MNKNKFQDTSTLLLFISGIIIIFLLFSLFVKNKNIATKSDSSTKTQENIAADVERTKTETPVQTPVIQDPSQSQNDQNWKIYKSSHYPYQLSYPDSFSYIKRDRGNTGNEGYSEQSEFENMSLKTTTITNFYTYIIENTQGSEFIFDQEPDGFIDLSGIQAGYKEMPQGYPDGGYEEPVLPMLVIQTVKNGALYKMVFMGIYKINDPFVQQVISNFKFL